MDDQSMFVARVVAFLAMRPGITVEEVNQDDSEDIKILIRCQGVFSMVSGLSDRMPVSDADIWCREILGSGLGDVWNASINQELDSEVSELLEDQGPQLVECPHGSGLCDGCNHLDPHVETIGCHDEECREIRGGDRLFPRNKCVTARKTTDLI